MIEQIMMPVLLPRRYQKRNSLNSCLAILGAAIGDVYAKPKQHGGTGMDIVIKGSIYNRYNLDELHEMLTELHRRAVKKHHHDLTGDEERMKEINRAVTTGRRLLNNRGGK